MSEYHKRLKAEILQIRADTARIRRASEELRKELEGELTFEIDMNIEMEAETNKWSK